jgi:hypothetical protein
METVVAKWDNFWNPPPTFIGALLLAMAIYLRSAYYFYPEKFSPKFTRRMANWFSAIIAGCGLIEIVVAAIDQIQGK